MMPSNADDPLRTADPSPGGDSAGPEQPSRSATSRETATFQPTTPPHAAAARHAPPPAIPGYEILGILGRGGMGVVYQARHLALKRTVALKMVLAGGHAGPGALARFRIEAEAVARLGHPNIVQIHEIGEADGHPYFALEYLEGGSLAHRLRGGPMGPREAAALVAALARAMQLAHSRNVVHRDLKPANVLLAADGTPKVSDFGLARQLDDDSGQTQAGAVVGTPSYMAPEQAAGAAHAAGPAADVYALGAILYECLTGRPPHRGATVAETLEHVRTREPDPPRRLRPNLPRDLETVCLKCLHKKPERRYASAEALAEDLWRWAAGEPIAARPVGGIERTALWVRRKPARAGLVLALVLLAVAVVTFIAVVAVRERQAALDLAGYNASLLRAQGEKEAALKEALRESARVAQGRGLNLCAAGDVGLGMTYLMRALDSAVKAEDVDLDSAIRFNIAAWETQLWSLRTYREGLAEGAPVSVSPLGTLLASARANNAVELWDLRDHDAQTRHSLPHGEKIEAMAFSADGSRLLTRTDQVVRVWDVASGRLAGPLLVHPSKVTVTALSPDGKWVLTGAGDPQFKRDNVKEATARLWQTDTGRCIASRPHKFSIVAAAFAPRGELALTGDAIGVVGLWKLPSGDAPGPALVHKAGIAAAAFSPDGTRVLTGTYGGTVHIWQALTGQPVFPTRPLGEWIRAVHFSPDGRRFVVLTHITRQAHLWQADAGNPIASPLPHHGQVESAAFSPDSQTLLTVGAGGFARGWDARRGQPTGPFLAHQGRVAECSFSGDGQSIVTVDDDGAVRRWQAPSALRLGPVLKHKGPVTAVAFSPDGRLLLTGSWDGIARLWDTTRGAVPPRVLKQGPGINAAAFSPTGRLALTGGSDGELSLWDVESGARRAGFKGHTGTVFAITFSHDGKMALSASADKTARLWDVETAKCLAVLPSTNFGAGAVAFGPSDRHALTGGADGTAALWDLSARPPAAILLAHDGAVETVAFSPDGDTAITGDVKSGTVRLWETATGTLRRTLKGHTLGVKAIAVSQDGHYLVSAGFDRTARLWSLATGESVGAPMQHQALVRHVAFSPDGHTVYTGSEDNTARRWHVPTGLPIGPALAPGGKVRVVAVHPESTLVAAGSWDNTAGLWEAPGPKSGSPAQLTRWAEQVTGIRLDESGAMGVLTSAAWHETLREAGRESIQSPER